MIKLRIALQGLFIIMSLVACDGGLVATDAEYVKRAQERLDKGQLQEAVIELKNALQTNPENAQARWLLGNAQLELGNAPAAEKELTRAQELGVARESVMPLLAKAWLQQGKLAQVMAVEPAPGLSPAARAEILAAQGSALLSQNRPEKASARFEQALSIEPASLAALVGKARLSAGKKEFKEARRLLATVFEKDKTHAPAWNLLGDIEMLEQRPEEAEAAYTRAMEYRPGSNRALMKRARLRIALKKLDEAQADLDLLQKRSAEHPDVSYLQGYLYFLQKRYQEARAPLQLTLRRDPQHIPAMFYLATIHFALGSREQARELAYRVVRDAPGYVPGRKLLAFINAQEGDWGGVERLMRPVIAQRDDDVVALKLLARALAKQGQHEEANRLLEKVVELQPESAVARADLGESLLRSGDRAGGIEHLRAAIELDPDFRQADVVLVMSYLRDKEFDKALEAAQAYRERNPKASGPLNMLGRVYLTKGQRKEAEQAFEEARRISPGDVYANHALAAIALQANQLAKARGFFEAVLVHHPDHLKTLLELSALDARENNQDAMVKRLEHAAAAHPNALRPRIVLARYYLGTGKPAKVPVVLGDLGRKHADHPLVLEVMGRSQLAQGAADDARETLERLVELQPQWAQAHVLLAQAHARLGDVKGLETELGKALAIDPSHFGARLSLTRLQMLQGKKEPAKMNLAMLKESAPDNPEVLFLEGAMAQGTGKPEEALDTFEKVFERASTTKTMLALAQQRWRTGDRDGSVALKEKWLAEHPEDLDARLELANSYLVLKRTDAAVEQYQQVLRFSETNLIALNNLAWYLKESDPKQALQYAEKAHALAPKSATIMDTLAVVLLYNGDTDAALRMNERALALRPGDPSLLYHKAMALEAAGKRAETISLLSELLKEPRAFPQRADAEGMLARLQAEGIRSR